MHKIITTHKLCVCVCVHVTEKNLLYREKLTLQEGDTERGHTQSTCKSGAYRYMCSL